MNSPAHCFGGATTRTGTVMGSALPALRSIKTSCNEARLAKRAALSASVEMGPGSTNSIPVAVGDREDSDRTNADQRSTRL
jgi:hypothetical protein